jgi:hypothetical protein
VQDGRDGGLKRAASVSVRGGSGGAAAGGLYASLAQVQVKGRVGGVAALGGEGLAVDK